MKTVFDFIPGIERAKLSPDLKSAILEILKGHTGKCEAIGGKSLLISLVRSGHKTDQRRMRLAISDLRRSGYLICSAPGAAGGYYMPANRAEFEEFLHTEYLAKIADMQETLHAMQSAARRQFTPNQLDLL